MNNNNEISPTQQKKCLNCSSSNANETKYCTNCGQQFHYDDTVKGFLMHFLSDYFTFDSKIFKSYYPLLFKPGYLTIEYLQGKRTKYIPPLRMYIFLSIVLFIVWQLGVVENSTVQISTGIADMDWDRFFSNYMPKIFFLLLPFFAIIIQLFHRNSSSKFIIDFIFSIHFQSFIFLILIVYAGISAILRKSDNIHINKYLAISISIYAFYYLWKALYEVYGDSKLKTLLKEFGILILYLLILIITSIGVMLLMFI